MRDESANRRLKIEAHDASRVEWSIYIPLPRGREINEAEVSLRLEFPENAYVPHDGWEQLQILARLSSPDEDAPAAEPLTADGLRRSALGVARRLKLLRESIPRVAVAHSLNPMPVAPSLLKDLDRILDQAVAALEQARNSLSAPQADDPPQLARERVLADEFLSGQLLKLLTVAEETCARMLAPAGLPGYRAVAGLGLWTLMTVGAVAYALKDRAKELTRQWLAGKLSHLYANRVLILREPERLERGRNVVLHARESLAQARVARADPLNPGSGAVQRVVTLDYRQRARVTRLKGPGAETFERLKIVFRYDLAPILTRLDDSVKRVPVQAGPGVRFADAPRLYRVPLSLLVSTPAGAEKREAVIVLNRRGIARIVPEGAPLPFVPAEVELPDLDEDGGELVPQP